MDDPKILERMRADWNDRAGEDANYYVAFGRREQDDDEFFATASDVIRSLERELKRVPGRDAALEIGCGPGRLMRPMSRHFTEIQGVDVSDAMIELARQRLRDTPNAHPHHGTGSDLSLFPDEKFDFVYSYAVYQHIPSRDVVFNYIREAWRVLKPGGILRCQINGLPPQAKQYDTWSGVRISPEEIAQISNETGFHLLALEQIWTQYVWITCRKASSTGLQALRPARIRNISNAFTGESAAPASGPMAALSLWIENLPPDASLTNLTVTADGRPCRVSYIGDPEADGVSQVNIALPEGVRSGLIPVAVQSIATPAWVRIIPPGPLVPRVTAITDGVNLLSGNRIESGCVKITMLEVANAADFRAALDSSGQLVVDAFCTDPVCQRYEFNLALPKDVSPGPHELRIAVGRRAFAPLAIEVA